MSRKTIAAALVGVLLLAFAGVATAQEQVDFTLKRTATSALSDADPNASAPAAAQRFTVPQRCGWGYSCTGYEMIWTVPDAISALVCTVTAWTLDGGTLGEWNKAQSVTGSVRRERMNELLAGNVVVWFQLVCTGATVDATNTLRVGVRGI